MKTWMAVFAALVLGASCAWEPVTTPQTYFRIRVKGDSGPVLRGVVELAEAPALLAWWRARGCSAWLERSNDEGWTWEQATDDGVQTTFTVEEKP